MREKKRGIIVTNKVKKLILLICVIFFISACAVKFQPVATIEELTTKEELEKRRSWVKQSHVRTTGAGGIGGTVILLPIGLIWASIPNEKDLTISEIADVAATKTYDYDSMLFSEWIGYEDGGLSVDYRIYGRGMGGKDANNIKPVCVIYMNQNKRKFYYEGWVIKKTGDSSYMHWRIPLLKKKDDGSMVYALDETLKLKEAKRSYGGFTTLPDFIFFKDAGDSWEITKKEEDIFKEIRDYFMKNNPKMTRVTIRGEVAEKTKIITKDAAGE
jgi:hypothetical protein